MKRIFLAVALLALTQAAFSEVLLTITKTPFERFTCSADFSREVGSGVISLTGVTATNAVTKADSTAQMIAASPAPAITPGTSVVTFQVQGGTSGDTQNVSVKVTNTSTGEAFEGVFVLQIKPR